MNLIEVFENARSASRTLPGLSSEKINRVLLDLADALVDQTHTLLLANLKDTDRMSVNDAKFDRLKLSASRIEDIARDLRNVAALESPLNRTILSKKLANGLDIKKISVPLGVVGVIYEARPNVTVDVFSLCFKTGNVALLKGGSDAAFSNEALMSVIQTVLHAHNIHSSAAVLLPHDRSATEELLNAVGYADVIIPRGSQQLIDYVRHNSKVPVIETGAGIVHAYFDKSGSIAKGKAIILNAKTRRVSVCNALDCLIIDRSRLADLAELVEPLAADKVRIFADTSAGAALKDAYPADLLETAGEEHYGTEFLDYKMSIKTVGTFDEALAHIARFSSKHSEVIIAEDENTIETFLLSVDAAAVYANASSAFTDGGQFGLGAEIGISTQKLHARGPMGLEELTSYKWVIKGDGQVREG